jgi:transglutaminase-like putative cysteine protease
MTEQKKWAFLQAVPSRDAQNPRLVRVAQCLWEATSLCPRRVYAFGCLALAIARDAIRFESDVKRTGAEDIAGLTRTPAESDAIDALERGSDDCDAKARLFVALCLAMGVQGRMAPIWKRDEKGPYLAHVFGEALIEGRWMYAETTLSRARLGDYPTSVPKETLTHVWARSA